MTINEWIKAMKKEFGNFEYKAKKDGLVFKSKGHYDVDGNWVNPYVPPKMESKNGNKPRRR